MSAVPPAATPEQQPAAVAYILPAFNKRVQAIAADGQEERADDNPWVHMQLQDPFQQQVMPFDRGSVKDSKACVYG